MNLLIALVLLTQGGKINEPAYTLPFKSIVVDYEFSGYIEGNETFAVLNSGQTILMDSHIKRNGKTVDSSWVVTPEKGVKIINNDTTEMTLGEIFVVRYVIFKLMNSLATGNPPAKGAPFRKVGTEPVLGKKCDVYETQYMRKNTRISSYRGIPLLYIWTEPNGKLVTKKAVKLEIDKEFTHPLLNLIQK